MVQILLDKIGALAKSGKAMMSSSLALHGILFTITGSYYVTYAVIGPIISPPYDKFGLHRKNWSHTMKDTGTALAPLIPWGVTGAFVAETLQVSTEVFFLYATMTYLGITTTLIYIFCGVGITKGQGNKGA